MNDYHQASFAEALAALEGFPKGSEQRVRTLVSAGQSGTLTKAMFYDIVGGGFLGAPDSFYLRDVYVKAVSWSVYTTEYLEGLARLLRGHRVLEVCAGTGILAAHMQARGLDWKATDLEPVNDLVEKVDALAAVSIFKPEVVFVSWIPYTSDLDGHLVDAATKHRIPLIVVGEGNGGCTGSGGLWSRPARRLYCEDDLFDWFSDVPTWPGIHDFTTVVLPPGATLRGISGPVV